MKKRKFNYWCFLYNTTSPSKPLWIILKTKTKKPYKYNKPFTEKECIYRGVAISTNSQIIYWLWHIKQKDTILFYSNTSTWKCYWYNTKKSLVRAHLSDML